MITTTPTELPLNEYGAIDTSSSFGHSVIIEVTYNTDPEGKWVDDDNYENRTLHGPFSNEDEAQAWMNDYPDDTDVKDMTTLVLNAVRP